MNGKEKQDKEYVINMNFDSSLLKENDGAEEKSDEIIITEEKSNRKIIVLICAAIAVICAVVLSFVLMGSNEKNTVPTGNKVKATVSSKENAKIKKEKVKKETGEIVSLVMEDIKNTGTNAPNIEKYVSEQAQNDVHRLIETMIVEDEVTGMLSFAEDILKHVDENTKARWISTVEDKARKMISWEVSGIETGRKLRSANVHIKVSYVDKKNIKRPSIAKISGLFEEIVGIKLDEYDKLVEEFMKRMKLSKTKFVLRYATGGEEKIIKDVLKVFAAESDLLAEKISDEIINDAGKKETDRVFTLEKDQKGNWSIVAIE